MKRLLAVLIALSLFAHSRASAQPIKHQVTGLFAPEREQDLRETFDKIPQVKLLGIDFENAEASLDYDPAKVFPKATAAQIVQRLDELVKSASNHTFGIKPLRTIPREKLALIEIPVAGLDCPACCLAAYEVICKIDGVEKATASFREGRITALIDPAKIDRAKLEIALKKREVQVIQPKADMPAVSIERIRDDVKYLASDELQGRGIGSRGEELAIDYIAKQFEKAGLKPAGERGSFFQAVPLVMVNTGPNATLAIVKGDEKTTLKLGEEFAGVSYSQQTEDFDAEAVFLGHGITAPEFGWDDYKDTDVKGKVVVVFTNEPPSDDPKFFGGKALTYYGRWTYKYEEATRRGAKAVLIIHTDETAGYPYSVVRKLKGAQIQRAPGSPALAFAGWLSKRAGDKVLASVGLTVEQALQKADTRGFKAIPLGIRIKGHIPTTVRKIVTRNVIGLVEGSDPVLKSEAVLFTAHWDHLGVGKSSLGSEDVYNGALDNASGSAVLLEMARIWASQKPRPKRSALFLATTAEESGLLGATYYASHPVFPLGKTALNLNFDTVLPLGVPESVVVSGAERTTAWPLVQEIARKHKLAIEPDKMAHLGFYYRSDHFALARGGVPAFSVFPGEKIKGKPDDFAGKAMKEYIAKTYHTPADRFQSDWNLSGYPALMLFAFEVAREAANAKTLPTWNAGDEFRPAREKSGVK